MEMEQMVTRKCPSPMCNHILFPYCYSFTSISGQHTYTHISNSITNYCKYTYIFGQPLHLMSKYYSCLINSYINVQNQHLFVALVADLDDVDDQNWSQNCFMFMYRCDHMIH